MKKAAANPIITANMLSATGRGKRTIRNPAYRVPSAGILSLFLPLDRNRPSDLVRLTKGGEDGFGGTTPENRRRTERDAAANGHLARSRRAPCRCACATPVAKSLFSRTETQAVLRFGGKRCQPLAGRRSRRRECAGRVRGEARQGRWPVARVEQTAGEWTE